MRVAAGVNTDNLSEGLRSRSATSGTRRRLLANHARVAILAGRLNAEDLGDSMASRGYYSTAIDAVREARDDDLAAYTHGHAARLCASEGQTTAALEHVSSARADRVHPAVLSWARRDRSRHPRRH